MSFMNLKGGDRVEFRQYAGLGLKGPEYKNRVAKVQRLLVFDDHVIVNLGGPYGTPGLVDASNFVRVVRRAP